MKSKIFNFLKITFILSGILLFSNSCTKDKWYNDTVMNMVDVDILQSDWKWDSDLGQFYATVSFPEIGYDLLNNGTVNATIKFDNTYVPLPYTYFFTENGKEFTETVSFEYSEGEVVFTVSAIDQFNSAGENYKPISKHFVVTTIAKLQ